LSDLPTAPQPSSHRGASGAPVDEVPPVATAWAPAPGVTAGRADPLPPNPLHPTPVLGTSAQPGGRRRSREEEVAAKYQESYRGGRRAAAEDVTAARPATDSGPAELEVTSFEDDTADRTEHPVTAEGNDDREKHPVTADPSDDREERSVTADPSDGQEGHSVTAERNDGPALATEPSDVQTESDHSALATAWDGTGGADSGTDVELEDPAGEEIQDVAGAAQLRPGDVGETSISFWDQAAGDQFRAEWHEVKAQFVDDPVAALTRARGLLTEAVQELSESMLAERDELDPLWETAAPDTESMRIAMRGYTEFLERILAL